MVLISPVISTTLSVGPLTEFAKSITVPFTVPKNDNQEISFARVFARVDIFEPSLSTRTAKVFFNGRLIGEKVWNSFEVDPFILDREVNVQGVRANEENSITIIVERGATPLFVSVTFSLFADFFYQVVNTETGEPEEPGETPTLEEPIIVEGETVDGILDFLFGDIEKTTRTIVAVGAVIAAIVLIPPIVRLVMG